MAGGTMKIEPDADSPQEEATAAPMPDAPKSIATEGIKNPRDSILELLQQAVTSGSFATDGDCCSQMTMPGLRVDGVGSVGLPLSEAAALDLLKKCGKTDSTGGNDSMGMNPGKVVLENPSWDDSVQELADDACYEKLGVDEDAGVNAVLHKLVVLEKGSSMDALISKDEKMNGNGVFGTLIVTLPSRFEGGAIQVRHEGQSKTVFSPSKDSPYKSQYAVFYNDCELECQPVTEGYCLCLIYNLVSENHKDDDGPPLPSAGSNNRFSIVKQLRDAAKAWDATFDGNKLVIMVDHLNHSSSKFQGDDKAVVRLLKLATKEGVDLAWSRGTVRYRIYGYGCGPRWMGHSWSSTEESKMTLHLRNMSIDGEWDGTQDDSDTDNDYDNDYGQDDNEGNFDAYEDYDDGDVSLKAATEMIPSNFYDSRRPDEEFEDTYHALKGKRTYDNQSAIVLWPKSWTWRVVTKGDLDEMTQFVLRDNPDAARTEMLSGLILDKTFDSGWRSSGRGVVSSFMELLAALEDPDIAVSFWKQYLAKQREARRVPDEILSQLGPFLEAFGTYEDVQSSLLASASVETVKQVPNAAISFVSNCVKCLLKSQTKLCQQLLESLLGSLALDNLECKITAPAAETFLALFDESASAILGGATIVSKFLDSLTRASCRLTGTSYHTRTIINGPVELLGIGLPKVCAVLGWLDLKDALANVISKLVEHGSQNEALELIKEMSGPDIGLLDRTGNKYRACAIFTELAIEPALKAAMKKSSVTAIVDVIALAEVFCPSKMDIFVQDILKLDVDSTIVPVILALQKQDLSDALKEALSKLAAPCVQVLSTRLAVPDKDVINWSLPAHIKADTEINKKDIDNFLVSPCKGSLSFELAKYSHDKLLNDLRPLVSSGNIKAYPSRPSGVGRWSFQIDKLKSQHQPAASALSWKCTCWPLWSSGCKIEACKAQKSRREKDESTLHQLSSFFSPTGTTDATTRTDQRKRKWETTNDPSEGQRKVQHKSGKSASDAILID